MHLGELCNHPVITCGRDTTAAELARLMREGHVGDVVVVDGPPEAGTPVGVVTDRDLVTQVLALGLDARRLTAGQLMSPSVCTALDSEEVEDAVLHMSTRGVRRLPVVDRHNRLRGVVSADDLSAYLAHQMNQLGRVMTRQLQIERNARP